MYSYKATAKYITKALLTLTFFLLFTPVHTYSSSPPLKISILQTVEHPALNATKNGFIEQLKALGYEDGKDVKIEYQTAQGNPSLATQIAQKFAADKPNIIVAIATLAAQAAVSATKNQDIPIVFASVTDPLAAKLVTDLKKPVGQVTGVSNFIPIEPQFALFKKVLPSLKSIGVIYNPGEANSVYLVEQMQKLAETQGLEIVTASASKTSEVYAAAQSLCGKADAIFVNNDNTALSAFSSVVKAADACNIPAFVSDIDLAKEGAMASLGPDQFDIGRQTAEMVDKILKNPANPMPPVEFPRKTEEHISSS